MSDEPGFIAFGRCFACGRIFGFNPLSVPSIPVDENGEPDEHGTREPICQPCITVVNAHREAHGLPVWTVAPDAYDAVAGDLPDDG